MSVTRIKQGGVTATITGPDAAAWGSIVEKMGGALAGKLQALAQGVASAAESAWYGPEGVTRETGLSGNIEVFTTIDRDKGEIRIGVGSTDTRTAKVTGQRGGDTRGQAGGRTVPIVAFIHRAGRTATILKAVSREEHFAAPKSLRFGFARREQNGRFVHAKRGEKGLPGGQWWIYEGSPNASDGAKLYEALIRKPFRIKIKASIPDMAAAMARAGRS